ncbi:MAG: DinB family protein [Terracidiphilus sp.]
MPENLAQKFRADLDEVHRALVAVPLEFADLPWREGGWTRKQIVGHLLDSAANNRQRFVRAAIDGKYVGPRYAQDAWVAAHGYSHQPWETLLGWWEAEHEILMAVVDNIPADKLDAQCIVGDDAPVSLRFLIEDYVSHQRWHLKQLRTGVRAH